MEDKQLSKMEQIDAPIGAQEVTLSIAINQLDDLTKKLKAQLVGDESEKNESSPEVSDKIIRLRNKVIDSNTRLEEVINQLREI